MDNSNCTREVLGIELDGSAKLTDILRAAAVTFGVSQFDFDGRSRERRFVEARFAAFALALHGGRFQSTVIARRVGIDRTTVVHGANRAVRWSRRDLEYRNRIVATWMLAVEGPAAIREARRRLDKARDAERAKQELDELQSNISSIRCASDNRQTFDREMGLWTRTQLCSMHEAHRLSLIAAGGIAYDGGRIEL
jgi:hypothetical protein